MTEKKDIDIVAAGHLCLDLIPAFILDKEAGGITSVLVLGKMIDMGDCVVVGGGPVTNADVKTLSSMEKGGIMKMDSGLVLTIGGVGSKNSNLLCKKKRKTLCFLA